MSDITNLISQIPNILQYFVPGAFFVIIFTHLCSVQLSSTYKTILSCIISYVCIALINITIAPSFWGLVILSVLLSCILGILTSRLFVSKWFKSLLIKTFYKSPHNDMWRNVLSFDKGTNLKVYLKDKSYYIIGHYHSHEEKGNDSWFCLSSHIKYDKDNNEIVNYEEDKNAYITFLVRDVETIEIFQ